MPSMLVRIREKNGMVYCNTIQLGSVPYIRAVLNDSRFWVVESWLRGQTKLEGISTHSLMTLLRDFYKHCLEVS